MEPIASGARRTTLGALWDATRLRLLVELDRQASISAAARAVGITQSTASGHLRVLETAAGQPLVERNGRGSRLNEPGRVLAARAAQALAALAAGEEELADLAGLKTGTIHLGASTVPGVYLLPDTLGCFRADYPGVQVQVEVAATAATLQRLLAGHIQLALVGGHADDDRLTYEPFIEDEIVGVARPGLLPVTGGQIEPDALADVLLLAREAGSSTQRAADTELAAVGITPSGTWELGSSEAIKRAARVGLGYAFLSRYAVAEEIARGELESFRINGRPPLERHFSIARPAGGPASPSEAVFTATLIRCCAKAAAYAGACLALPAGRKAGPAAEAHLRTREQPRVS